MVLHEFLGRPLALYFPKSGCMLAVTSVAHLSYALRSCMLPSDFNVCVWTVALSRAHRRQSLLLSSYRRCDSFLRRSSLLHLDESPEPPFEITTGWWRGRFKGFSGLVVALAAACRSHISFDLTQMSSICSSVRQGPGVVIRKPSSPYMESVNEVKPSSHRDHTSRVYGRTVASGPR